jgi:hypothetical protein
MDAKCLSGAACELLNEEKRKSPLPIIMKRQRA